MKFWAIKFKTGCGANISPSIGGVECQGDIFTQNQVMITEYKINGMIKLLKSEKCPPLKHYTNSLLITVHSTICNFTYQKISYKIF